MIGNWKDPQAKSADVMSASYGGILVAGHDGVAERGGGDAGSDGGTVGRHQQRLREVEEGVEHCLVILADHRVELPGKKSNLVSSISTSIL